MKQPHGIPSVCFAIGALALAGTASATDGYFATGYGTHYKGLAGAGVALHLGPQGVATNPASAAFLGKRFDVGLAVFNPNRQFSVSGVPSGLPGTFGLAPGTVESQSSYFPIPSLGASWTVGDGGALAIAAYGNGGMNTDYAAAVFGSAPAGVDLSQLFLAPTYAHRFGRHAVGASAILAYQRFEARGLAGFSPFSSDPSHLSDNDHASAFGAGVRLGYIGEIAPWLSIGASYQSRIQMGRFDSYSGLFAEHGGFDIPQTAVGGIALMPDERWTLALDVQWINYEGVASVSNDFLPNLAMAPLGMEDGAGFGWHDMTIYKAGLQFESDESWTWRAGYSYGRQPIRDDEVLINILAPGVMEHHLTLGLSRALGERQALHFAVTRAIPKSFAGGNNLEVPGAQSIELQMDQWELDLSFSFGF